MLLYEALQVLVTAALAAYPWCLVFDVLAWSPRLWIVWGGVIGAQSLSILLRPTRTWLVPQGSFTLLAGLCAIQGIAGWVGVVQDGIQRDQFAMSSWLAASLRGWLEAPATLLSGLRIA